MKRINPAWTEKAAPGISGSPFFDLLGMQVRELSWGRSRLEMEVASKHLQPFGYVHGGAFSSLVDAAGFWAAFTMVPPGLGATTVELKLNYLAPAQEGRLVGLGRCLKMGRSLGLAEARVENERGELLAHGTTSIMVLPSLGLDSLGDLPPKYLPD